MVCYFYKALTKLNTIISPQDVTKRKEKNNKKQNKAKHLKRHHFKYAMRNLLLLSHFRSEETGSIDSLSVEQRQPLVILLADLKCVLNDNESTTAHILAEHTT